MESLACHASSTATRVTTSHHTVRLATYIQSINPSRTPGIIAKRGHPSQKERQLHLWPHPPSKLIPIRAHQQREKPIILFLMTSNLWIQYIGWHENDKNYCKWTLVQNIGHEIFFWCDFFFSALLSSVMVLELNSSSCSLMKICLNQSQALPGKVTFASTDNRDRDRTIVEIKETMGTKIMTMQQSKQALV